MDKSLVIESLVYCPLTGALHWKARPEHHFCNLSYMRRWNNRYAGQPALTALTKDGHCVGSIGNNYLAAHRAAWVLQTGDWPTGSIDHIDGDGSNNKFSNLRDVSHKENNRNARRPKTNNSGQVGVSYYKQTKRWHARIGREKSHLGFFKTFAEAVDARKKAEKKLNYSERHGA